MPGKVENRVQFANAVLGLRGAQELADNALVLYWVTGEREVPGFHLSRVEQRCDRVEQLIAAFRLELQAQRSRVEARVTL